MKYERVFLAEKPAVGEAIASYLSKSTKHAIDMQRGFIRVGRDAVTWANGHLFEDAKPEDYDRDLGRWSRANLPFVPKTYRRVIRKGSEVQLDILRGLLPTAKTIVHACDIDREGQRIGDDILDELNLPTDGALRLPVRGFSYDSLHQAFNKIKPNKQFAALTQAARVRSQADMLVGFNGTPALSLTAREKGYIGERDSLPVGRVLSPTTAFCVALQKKIDAFVPTAFYGVGIVAEGAHEPLVMKWIAPKDGDGISEDGHVVDRGLVEAVMQRLSRVTVGHVVTVEDDLQEKEPPLPFSLASLQSLMNKRYALTAKETLDAASRLYKTHFLISYPRANCRYYEREDLALAPGVLESVARNLPQLSEMIGLADMTLVSRAWDSGKVGAHAAIAPINQLIDMGRLNEAERHVYEAICRSFIAQFFPAATTMTRRIVARFDMDFFEVRHSAPAEWGWKIVRSAPPDDAPDAPEYAKDDRLVKREAAIVEGETSPPQQFTDGSLIAALNAIEKHVDDPDLKAVLGTNAKMGTEATQAEIIENMVKYGFVKREKKALIPTERGKDYVASLPPELQGPGLTAVFELALSRIESDASPAKAFLNSQEDFARELVETMKTAPFPKKDEWQPKGRQRDQNAGETRQRGDG